ncbi:hypothetical protein PC129_g7757 [Phytophthora cactorum]|uniref:Uncharacterized protein n=2 Tax=Phytophthora cactorum TaxID=29920 RepID=A0A8T0Z6J1_9STRA|nr:hypothetical protein PC111_g20429 [Phytophthora cactorum]KAG2857979.1 hypothetical protein PC113_g10214 [Phytophthora cactorum]KAG3033493.1 hypothetical protein PC119_g5296 [Phytophthora cactorum]KAG3221491.1 hypothetical protein PC129_g7757 [Phytophthora cactorum]
MPSSDPAAASASALVASSALPTSPCSAPDVGASPTASAASNDALEVANVPESLYVASSPKSEAAAGVSRFAPFEESYDDMNELRRALKSNEVEIFIRSPAQADTTGTCTTRTSGPTLPLDSSMQWMEALCAKAPLMILVGWVSQVARTLFQRYERYGHLSAEYPAEFHSLAAEYEGEASRFDVRLTAGATPVREVHTDDVASGQDDTTFLVSTYGDALAFDNSALGGAESESHVRDGQALHLSSDKRRRLVENDNAEEKKSDEGEETSGVALV